MVSPPPSWVMKKSLDPCVPAPPPPMDSELVVMSGTIENDIKASTPLARFCRSSLASLLPDCAEAAAASVHASAAHAQPQRCLPALAPTVSWPDMSYPAITCAKHGRAWVNDALKTRQIGRASCRERVCQYV